MFETFVESIKRVSCRQMQATLAISCLLIYSGSLGSRIIAAGLVGHNGFQLYGPLGKTCCFTVLAFWILSQRSPLSIKLPLKPVRFISMLVCGAVSFCFALHLIGRLATSTNLLTIYLLHLSLIGCLVTCAAASSGLDWLYQRWIENRYICLKAAFSGLCFIVLLFGTYCMWSPLSQATLYMVAWFLQCCTIPAHIVVPQHTLVLPTFAITIAPYCSGIESLALFSGSYGLYGLLNWPHLHHWRYFIALMPGILLVFMCNIIRLWLLVLIGTIVNPRVAQGIFHTYAGLIIFIVYTVLFLNLCSRWVIRAK